MPALSVGIKVFLYQLHSFPGYPYLSPPNPSLKKKKNQNHKALVPIISGHYHRCSSHHQSHCPPPTKTQSFFALNQSHSRCTGNPNLQALHQPLPWNLPLLPTTDTTNTLPSCWTSNPIHHWVQLATIISFTNQARQLPLQVDFLIKLLWVDPHHYCHHTPHHLVYQIRPSPLQIMVFNHWPQRTHYVETWQ